MLADGFWPGAATLGSLKRAMSVVKTRASRHESATRQYDIGRHGITIGDIAQPEE